MANNNNGNRNNNTADWAKKNAGWIVASLLVLGFGIKQCADGKDIKSDVQGVKTEVVKDAAKLNALDSIAQSVDNRTKDIKDVVDDNNNKLSDVKSDLDTLKVDADSIMRGVADVKDSTHVIIEQAKKCCGAKKPVAPKKEVAPVKPVEPVIDDCGCDTVPVMHAPSAPVCDHEPVYYQPAVAVVPNVPADNVVVVQNSEATVVINGNNNVVNVNQEPKASDAECVDSVKHTVIMSVEFYCSRRGRRR
ncbi:MAG: hypothetical protein ACLRFJ_03510 [Alphaproteobacteria bacterium]